MRRVPWLLCLWFSIAEALYGYGLIRCQFSPNDGHNATYQAQVYFNKMLIGEYNSTLEKYFGYTKIGVQIANILNKDEASRRKQIEYTKKCQDFARLYDQLFRTAEPYVRLKSVEDADGKYPRKLLCSVYNFYPPQIAVSWLKNGKKVTAGVTSTVELPNGNWLYQAHYSLEYTPTSGERIACMVEHASLKEPKLYHWVPISESVKNKIAVGTAGLVLGAALFIAGLIFNRKNASGHAPVPAS